MDEGIIYDCVRPKDPVFLFFFTKRGTKNNNKIKRLNKRFFFIFPFCFAPRSAEMHGGQIGNTYQVYVSMSASVQ